MSQAEKQLHSLLATYEASLNAADAARIEQLFTEDGVFMPAGFPTASGRSAVRSAYDASFAIVFARGADGWKIARYLFNKES